jgi:hypothetical protein
VQVYEEALQSVPSARMYELYAEFLIGNLEHDDEQLESDDLASGQMSACSHCTNAPKQPVLRVRHSHKVTQAFYCGWGMWIWLEKL